MRACVWVGCNWWMMAKNSFVCIILLLNECMQDVVKVQRNRAKFSCLRNNARPKAR